MLHIGGNPQRALGVASVVRESLGEVFTKKMEDP